MKDRQAELEKNIVAEHLGSFFKKIEPYSKLILAGIVGIVVALIGFGLYSSGETAKRSDATFMLLTENSEVAVQFPGTVASAWYLVFQADGNLAQGINSLYMDRDEAEALLEEAIGQYKEAIKDSKDKVLTSRANYGMGLAKESLGEVDAAVKAYQAAVDADESEQMVEVAQERIDRLSRPKSTEFLTWFSDQDFSPADPSLPPELSGLGDLPDMPDSSLPELDLEMGLGDDLEASDKPITGGLELPDESEMKDGESETGDETESSETEADDSAADSGETETEEAETAVNTADGGTAE